MQHNSPTDSGLGKAIVPEYAEWQLGSWAAARLPANFGCEPEDQPIDEGIRSMGIVTAYMSVSVDGYGAGPNQSREKPFGDGGNGLHRWMFEHGDDHAEEITDQTSASAYVMGRNMFGPVRGEWPDEEWRGWWGEDPPYHAPVFVLTHHARPPLEMEGGTSFTFVTDGLESVLQQARAAAGDGDVDIAGGPATINQYLSLGAIDRLRLDIVPIVLGGGTRLFDDVPPLDLTAVSAHHTPEATHVTYEVRHG